MAISAAVYTVHFVSVRTSSNSHEI